MCFCSGDERTDGASTMQVKLKEGEERREGEEKEEGSYIVDNEQ